jgi:AmmeMemoRadiSam system protein A
MTISPEDGSKLVSLAREAVAAEVNGCPYPLRAAEGILAERRGCFVTLTNGGHLRGCIGTFRPDKPLVQAIPEMARAAAHDPRFYHDPIRPGELAALKVEVSVLSPLEPTDRPEDLEIGTHGIYVMSGGAAGCFLPEVATDMGWDTEQFLSHCCASKAGLRADAWRDPATKVYLFTSEKFEE